MGEALTAWSGFVRFCEQEMGLEAQKLLEALARPFAEVVRDLEELSGRARRGGVRGHHDGGVAARNRKGVRPNISRG